MAKTMFDSKLAFNKNMNEGMKRALRDRLKVILDVEEKSFAYWNDNVKSKMNITRQAQVERRFHKEIQAFKIVIHKLTPFSDRTEDEPSIFVKKKPVKKEIKGLIPVVSTAVIYNEPELQAPTLSPDQISILSNLADLLNPKK